jgi:hypothetical protein
MEVRKAGIAVMLRQKFSPQLPAYLSDLNLGNDQNIKLTVQTTSPVKH